jgi:hypothetical protein
LKNFFNFCKTFLTNFYPFHDSLLSWKYSWGDILTIIEAFIFLWFCQKLLVWHKCFPRFPWFSNNWLSHLFVLEKLYSLYASNNCLLLTRRETLTWSNFSWSKVSVNFGVWSNALFVSWLKFLIIDFYTLSFDQIISHVFSWSKVLLMSFWVILNFRSTAKICKLFFGTWSKVFKLIELVLMSNF